MLLTNLEYSCSVFRRSGILWRMRVSLVQFSVPEINGTVLVSSLTPSTMMHRCVAYVYDYACGIGLLLNQECTYTVNDAIEAHVE